MATSAPTSTALATASPSCTPEVSANEQSSWDRSSAHHRRGRSSSPGVDRWAWSTTSSASRSTSGWRNRLNSTRPAAPARTSRAARWARAEYRGRQLDRDGHLHLRAHLADQLDELVLHLRRGVVWVGCHGVGVELDRRGTGVHLLAGVAGPSPGGGTVERGDHRHVHRGHRRLQVAEVGPGPGPVVAHLREPTGGLAEAARALVQHLLELQRVGVDLLLEQRRQHHGAGAGVHRSSQQVQVPADGGGGGDHRAAQLQPQVAGGQVDAHSTSSSSDQRSISPICS